MEVIVYIDGIRMIFFVEELKQLPANIFTKAMLRGRQLDDLMNDPMNPWRRED